MARNAKYDSGMLPPNTRYYSRDGAYELVVMEIPEQVREIEFRSDAHGAGNEKGTFKVITPRLVVCLDLKNGTDGYSDIFHTRIFALKETITTPQTEIFYFPFGNVDTRVCWGTTHLPRYRTGEYQGLGGIVSIFYGTLFNGHLEGYLTPIPADPSYKFRNDTVATYFQLLKFLEGKTEFPYDVLRKFGRLEVCLQRGKY